MPSSISHLAAEAAKEREAQRPRLKKPPVVRPLTEEDAIGHTGTRYSIAQRAYVLTLYALCWTTAQIAIYLKIPDRQVRRIVDKAKKRGYKPQEDPRVLDYFVEDGYRPGRPKEVSEIKEEEVLTAVRINRSTRQKSTEVLAYEHGISTSSTLRILHKYGLNNVKPTTKPGLN
jgi:transposase